MCIVAAAVGKKKLRAKETLNSEEIKPIALSIVELCLARGISRQAVSQSQEKYSIETCWKGWGCFEDINELNQAVIKRKSEDGFRAIFLGKNPNLYYSTVRYSSFTMRGNPCTYHFFQHEMMTALLEYLSILKTISKFSDHTPRSTIFSKMPFLG